MTPVSFPVKRSLLRRFVRCRRMPFNEGKCHEHHRKERSGRAHRGRTPDVHDRREPRRHGASPRRREALVDSATERRWTYDQLLAEVDTVALGLLDLGVAKGDRVGIWAPNCAEWVFVQYATARIGAILVNVNPAYRSHELAFVVGQSGMRTIVAVPEYKGSNYAEMIAAAEAEHPTLNDTILIGQASWDDLRERGAQGDRARLDEIGAGLDAADPINIQYTSGTTGFPKGATLSHANILNNGWFVGELIDYTESDRVCIPVPFYHCFGMVMGNLACTSHGATMVIPAPGVRSRSRRCSRSRRSGAPRCTASRRCSSRCSASRSWTSWT